VNELPASKKAVGSCIAFKKKLDEHSNCVKFKVHIVAKGFLQVPGKDFSETFSSVTKFTTLWVFFTLAVYLDFEIHQVDVVAAYLQGDLDKEIYMCHMQVDLSGNYIPVVISFSNYTSLSFSQHILQQYCNHLGIPSSTAEILLFDLVFYDVVTPVSVSTLKPPLRVIGALFLKPRASPIISICI